MSTTSTPSESDLASLIGSRICHDLISPIGAIGNGIELLSMAGAAAGPEMELISESVRNANDRIRFYRIAFGQASSDQAVSRSEAIAILAGNYDQSRLQVTWDLTVDCRRDEVKAAFLAILCLESSLPYGGTVHVARPGTEWVISGKSDKLKPVPEAIAALDGSESYLASPAMVQFSLLPAAIEGLNRRLLVSEQSNTLVFTF